MDRAEVTFSGRIKYDSSESSFTFYDEAKEPFGVTVDAGRQAREQIEKDCNNPSFMVSYRRQRRAYPARLKGYAYLDELSRRGDLELSTAEQVKAARTSLVQAHAKADDIERAKLDERLRLITVMRDRPDDFDPELWLVLNGEPPSKEQQRRMFEASLLEGHCMLCDDPTTNSLYDRDEPAGRERLRRLKLAFYSYEPGTC